MITKYPYFQSKAQEVSILAVLCNKVGTDIIIAPLTDHVYNLNCQLQEICDDCKSETLRHELKNIWGRCYLHEHY